MVLQSSGAISLNDIQNEFGGSNPIGINEYYGAASGIPSSGTISFNQFYGKSAEFSMLVSKELLGNQGFNNYTLNVVKDHASSSTARAIPAHSNPSSSSLTPSGTRYYFNDWGDDFFDDWGDFYIYNPATGTAQYIEFSGGFMNNGDSVVWTETRSIHGKHFRIRHGWATQGIYKMDVECTDQSFEFCIGHYGNMGADGQMVNEDRQYTVPWGKLNYNYNWQNTGTAPYREHFFTHFVPRLKSFNDSITANYSSSNFGNYLHTEPPIFNNTHGDNLAIWTSALKLGGTFYYVKGGNSTTAAMYEWVANDIASIDCLYNFVQHTFTNCGSTGRTGPTLTQMRTEYAPWGNTVGGSGDDEYDYLSLWYSGDWDYLSMTTQGIQLWTVPSTGKYEIVMTGARGGYSNPASSAPGGRGGYLKGTKTFNAGTVLALIVGQAGEDATNNGYAAAGGGGASWVLSENLSTAYAVAGGGGGSNGNQYTSQGGWGDGVGNANDSGGGSSGSYSSGGGAGFGGNGSGGTGMGGQSPANGALGGDSTTQHSGSTDYMQDGGFGGGGSNGWHAGGGGGGFAGGDAVGYTTSPGALGGTTYSTLDGTTYGSASSSATHGYIKITRIWPVAPLVHKMGGVEQGGYYSGNSFTITGTQAEHTFTIQAGTTVRFQLYGGAGGRGQWSSNTGLGGPGGYVSVDIAFSSDLTVYAYVGEGHDAISVSQCAGPGGGSTDIRTGKASGSTGSVTDSTFVSNFYSTMNSVLAIAGGGGGAHGGSYGEWGNTGGSGNNSPGSGGPSTTNTNSYYNNQSHNTGASTSAGGTVHGNWNDNFRTNGVFGGAGTVNNGGGTTFAPARTVWAQANFTASSGGWKYSGYGWPNGGTGNSWATGGGGGGYYGGATNWPNGGGGSNYIYTASWGAGTITTNSNTVHNTHETGKIIVTIL